jgi:hypothetical protein
MRRSIMTEKSNEPFIMRLKKIWDKYKEEPDFSKYINKKEEEGDNKTLREKAVEASNKRTEIAGTHNTAWMPLTKEKDDA